MPLPTWPTTSLGAADPTTGAPAPVDPAAAGTSALQAALAGQAFVILRRATARTPTGGYTVAERPLPGSPFSGTLDYSKLAVKRGEEDGGVVTRDTSGALKLDDVAAGVLPDDVVILPAAVVGQPTDVRARVLRVRNLAGKLQCDLEEGAV